MYIQNSKTAEVFYARHIVPGIAAYKEGNALINKPALDEMNESFTGKPVVVFHQDWKNQEPVGYVVKSFWLPQDGAFWAEFIVDDINALKLIKNLKFSVSNGYKVLEKGVGGTYHDIPYKEEYTKGEYLHLALTDKPRYKEAIIMTRDEFKNYSKELEKIDNKFNEEDKTVFSFFKKQKLDNSEEILNSSFELDGKEYTVGKMIDILKTTKTKFETNDGEMSGEELAVKYNEMSTKLNEMTEKVDKKEIINEVSELLKGKVDETVLNDVLGKMEKVAFNACSNEDEEAKKKAEEEKKNEEEKAKKEAEEKAKAEEAKKKAEEEKANETELLKKRMEQISKGQEGKVERFKLVDGNLKKVE